MLKKQAFFWGNIVGTLGLGRGEGTSSASNHWQTYISLRSFVPSGDFGCPRGQWTTRTHTQQYHHTAPNNWKRSRQSYLLSCPSSRSRPSHIQSEQYL
eukprot:4473290-Amphidinium_carterae.1